MNVHIFKFWISFCSFCTVIYTICLKGERGASQPFTSTGSIHEKADGSDVRLKEKRRPYDSSVLDRCILYSAHFCNWDKRSGSQLLAYSILEALIFSSIILCWTLGISVSSLSRSLLAYQSTTLLKPVEHLLECLYVLWHSMLYSEAAFFCWSVSFNAWTP